jgi:hypothetical protein
MGKEVFERLRVGVHLARVALESHGTDRFWDAIGWWHGEVHYTIPRLEEEKRVAAELERAFSDKSIFVGDSLPFTGKVMTSNGYTSLTVGPSMRFGDRITLNPGQRCVGEWRWQGIAVRTMGRPARVRRLLLGVLLGAEWVADGDNKKTQVSLGPEYDRLAEFLTPIR